MQSNNSISRIVRTERASIIDDHVANNMRRGDKRNKPIRHKPAKRTWSDMEMGIEKFR